jgi:hypothetical protein
MLQMPHCIKNVTKPTEVFSQIGKPINPVILHLMEISSSHNLEVFISNLDAKKKKVNWVM